MIEHCVKLRSSIQMCSDLIQFLRKYPKQPISNYIGMFRHIPLDCSGDLFDVSMRLLEVLNDSNSTRPQREDFHAQLIWRYGNKNSFMNLLQTAFGGLK